MSTSSDRRFLTLNGPILSLSSSSALSTTSERMLFNIPSDSLTHDNRREKGGRCQNPLLSCRATNWMILELRKKVGFSALQVPQTPDGLSVTSKQPSGHQDRIVP
ncbi:hypothetical protein CDAR_612451 [Caerostris darwini]|uniref:Uncharacterized protein n=1 Tax=Caerostris darwini TaxID=1538125 RepID=A0AAV4SGC4_9ARAC|nr:hypothetical protein CDAR_612451 [Caerostris darwini]